MYSTFIDMHKIRVSNGKSSHTWNVYNIKRFPFQNYHYTEMNKIILKNTPEKIRNRCTAELSTLCSGIKT